MLGVNGMFVGILVFFLFFTVYCGIYGYANPDPEECWYTDGLEHSYDTKEEAQMAAEEANLRTIQVHNIHDQFVSWFVKGMYFNLICCIWISGYMLRKNRQQDCSSWPEIVAACSLLLVWCCWIGTA